MTKVEIYGQLLVEAAKLFREYEQHHIDRAHDYRVMRDESGRRASDKKAERNRDIAERIEAALAGVQ